jgi:integrase
LLLVPKLKVKYSNILLLEIFSGLRCGEILALKLSDIDFEHNIIKISITLTKNENDKTIIGKKAKTKKGIREFIIISNVKTILIKAIEEYVQNEQNLIFYNNKENKLITVSEINSVFKRLCKKYNIGKGYDVNQHMLRHTFTTRCIEAKIDIAVLKELLGHKDIKTTLNIYTSISNDFKEKELEKVDDYLNSVALKLH